MNSFEAFFNMGGYAVYIWPSYILSALVLGVLFIQSSRRLKKAERDLEDLGPKERRRGSVSAGTDKVAHDA